MSLTAVTKRTKNPAHLPVILAAAIRSSGFGMTINVINGGIECGKGAPTPQAQHRVQLYQKYCGILGVDPGAHLQC